MRKLDGKRIALITAHEFEDIEILVPTVRFAEEGASVTIATLPKDALGGAHFSPRPHDTDKTITGRFGSTIPLVVLTEGHRWHHREIPQLQLDDFDAVVITGGFAPDYLRLDATSRRFVADMHEAGKLVAAICHGPWVLISTDANEGTDLVRGRDVTCYAAVRDDIINAGGNHHDVPTVVSGNVITGRCPDDLADFCRAIIDHLAGEIEDGVYQLS